MVNFEKYKVPILVICIITGVLMLMLTIGFAIGILSDNPDGLERAIIDSKGEDWLEELPSAVEPPLGGIENDYIAGIIGIILSVAIIIAVFYLIVYINKKKS
ncbi:MAG: hypothetical protein ACTSQJ_10010 [Promethearchaeota archaeon]